MNKINLIWNGVVFHPTGVATYHRNLIKGLIKKDVNIQIWGDFYNDEFDKDGELKKLYLPIDRKEQFCQLWTYTPDAWGNTPRLGKQVAFCVHEGSKIPEHWPQFLNQLELLCVPSKATKNLFFSGGVRCPIAVVPLGINPSVFTPKGDKVEIKNPDFNEPPFVFLYVNSWTGKEKDRKGADVLIQAFTEEFKKKENVVLYLKLSTFWSAPIDAESRILFFARAPREDRPPIISDQSMLPEELLPKLYRAGNVFVSPTRGESFGLSIAEAMACGLPVIVTNDNQSGHMEFVPKDNWFIDKAGMEQSPEEFYCKGNLSPIIDKIDLRKKLRQAYELYKKSPKKFSDIGKNNSKYIQEKFNWDLSADKFCTAIREVVLR